MMAQVRDERLFPKRARCWIGPQEEHSSLTPCVANLSLPDAGVGAIIATMFRLAYPLALVLSIVLFGCSGSSTPPAPQPASWCDHFPATDVSGLLGLPPLTVYPSNNDSGAVCDYEDDNHHLLASITYKKDAAPSDFHSLFSAAP